METQWRFFINGTPCGDPIGWDSLELTLQRDPIFQGLENIFSDNITFWDEGAQIIKTEYEADGIDAQLEFLSEYSCDGGITWNSFVSGVLNAYFYSIINNEVTIKIEPSGFHRKIKNRLSTPINLNSNISIGGSAMSTINPFDLGLHSKEIVQQGQVEMTLGTFSENYTPIPTVDTLYFTLPFDNINFAEFSEWQFKTPPLINSSQGTPERGSIYHNDTSDPIDVSFDYIIKGTLTELLSITRSYHLTLVYAISNSSNPFTAGDGIIFEDYGVKSNIGGVVMSQDIDLSGTIIYTIPAGYSYYLYFVFANYNNSTTPQTATIEFIKDNLIVTGTITSIEDPSTSKAFLIHEVFAKLSESMTDEIDSFRSDFFGRIDSLPHVYDNNGCGAWVAISNGLNIRNMKDNQTPPQLFPNMPPMAFKLFEAV